MIKPIKITDSKTNDVYVLEFNRETVMFAENRGFDVERVSDRPMSGIADLFFYAFRMHHPKMAKANTDKILFEDLGGVPEGMVERLTELYFAPFESLMVKEGGSKNSRMTVEM